MGRGTADFTLVVIDHVRHLVHQRADIEVRGRGWRVIAGELARIDEENQRRVGLGVVLEGVHAPEVSGVALGRGNHNDVEILQGRGIGNQIAVRVAAPGLTVQLHQSLIAAGRSAVGALELVDDAACDFPGTPGLIIDPEDDDPTA